MNGFDEALRYNGNLLDDGINVGGQRSDRSSSSTAPSTRRAS